MDKGKLIDIDYWNKYWSTIRLPLEYKKTKDNLYLNEILAIFDKYLPQKQGLSILEIGGAPGRYLAYMNRKYKYKPHCLDYSSIGCEKTKRNFKLLNIKGKVYHIDLFSKNLKLPLFDVVYSLGFIEHFININSVIEMHLKLVKKDGLLLIGLPNFLGINHFFLKRLNPELLLKHNLSVMDINTWKTFEEKFNLKLIFKGYIGGFEPGVFNRKGENLSKNNIFTIISELLYKLFHSNLKMIRRINSKFISGYIIGIYQKKK